MVDQTPEMLQDVDAPAPPKHRWSLPALWSILRRVMLWHALGRPLDPAPNKPLKHPRLRRWAFALAYRTALVPLLLIPLWAVLIYAIMHPTRREASTSPQLYTLSSRDVSFTSADGVALDGWYINSVASTDLTTDDSWKNRRPAVVLCHDYGAARDQLLSPLAVNLVKAGYDVLLFDFRGHGTSGDAPVSMGPIETADVIAAVECLRQQPGVDGERIGVLGFGMGGYCGILAAARREDVRCVVGIDAYPSVSSTLQRRMQRAGLGSAAGAALSWGMGMIFGHHRMDDSAAEVTAALDSQGLLLVTGGANDLAPMEDLDRVIHVANSKTARFVVPGARNGQALFSSTTSDMVIQYFDAMLDRQSPDAEVVTEESQTSSLGKIQLSRSEAGDSQPD